MDAAPGAAEGGKMIDKKDVFVREMDVSELILQNLFSDETEKYFNCCTFTSDRMAFMQGMNYAALLCTARLERYIAIIHPEPPEEEE